MFLVWLFRFDCFVNHMRRKESCFVYDICVFCTLLIVLPILLTFCSDFWHECAPKYVMAKWGISLAIEYCIAHPIMVAIQLYLWSVLTPFIFYSSLTFSLYTNVGWTIACSGWLLIF